jgi:NADH:ubiquinone oxidoreductase subunit H
VFTRLYVRSIVPRLKFTDLIMLTWKTFLPIVLLSLILCVLLNF